VLGLIWENKQIRMSKRNPRLEVPKNMDKSGRDFLQLGLMREYENNVHRSKSKGGQIDKKKGGPLRRIVGDRQSDGSKG